ncbi:DUF6268 family outer membrane beta-barrel protein [Aureibacter tunicatorum]|uniref:DUF6268 domain-containing protein n=1 Tax=Aureibacter tunicatorum TaxID=866807 RepID=A0AAE3XPA7_9BACT|nr:DUF6268 family outer membrane beta-barrel protein [Aureibacter tunicatorum]MDR6239550.1 hypothetical protein [Aureibacter tunicatorum]BDD04027.1 hypothetical protein AUTU_15100 [Aureibacter tunicatorum]
MITPKYFIAALLNIILINISHGQANSEKSDTVKYKPLFKFPIASASHTIYTDSRVQNDPDKGSVGMTETQLLLNMPVKLKEKKLFLYNGLNFNILRSSYKSEVKTIKEELYSISYSTGIISILPKRWKATVLITPTLSSDLDKEITKEDLNIQSTFLALKRANPYKEYGFGLMFNARFGRGLVLPIFSYSYKKNNWSVYTVLPGFVSGFRHFKKSNIGLYASMFGSLHNFYAAGNSNSNFQKIGYTRFTVGPKFQFNVYKSLYMDLTAGAVLLNRLETFDATNARVLETNFNEKLFIRINISILK